MTLPPPPFYRFRPHPWHGLETGANAPRVVNAYVEITPFDTMKYEIDKTTGYLRLDRPQRGSAQPPTLYGFVPRTHCAARVAALSQQVDRADGDPLDICIISERPITRSEILLSARVVGGIKMIDDGEADDKIVAVLDNDPFWDEIQELASVPKTLVERLVHYFSTYKLTPGNENRVSIVDVYDRGHAWRVIEAAIEDYKESYELGAPSLRF
jgi:inorganic pyrophosphatase